MRSISYIGGRNGSICGVEGEMAGAEGGEGIVRVDLCLDKVVPAELGRFARRGGLQPET